MPDSTSKGQGALRWADQGVLYALEDVEPVEGAEGQNRCSVSVVSEKAREGDLGEKDEWGEEEVDVNRDAFDAFFRVFE